MRVTQANCLPKERRATPVTRTYSDHCGLSYNDRSKEASLYRLPRLLEVTNKAYPIDTIGYQIETRNAVATKET